MSEIIDLQQVPEQPAQEAPKFDPNKKYTWGAENTFTFSGAEFGVILNALRATLSTEEAARILVTERAHNIVEGALAKAVEEGRVLEVPETTKRNGL